MTKRFNASLFAAFIFCLPAGAGQEKGETLVYPARLDYIDVCPQRTISVREQDGLMYVDLEGKFVSPPRSERIHLIFPEFPFDTFIPIGGVVSGQVDPSKPNRARGAAQMWVNGGETLSTWNSDKSIYDPAWRAFVYERPMARVEETSGGTGWMHRDRAPDGTDHYIFYGEFRDAKKPRCAPYVSFTITGPAQQTTEGDTQGKN